MHYIEGDHILEFGVEHGPSSIGVYVESISAWNPPYDREAITPEKRREIVENLKEAFVFLEENAEFVW